MYFQVLQWNVLEVYVVMLSSFTGLFILQESRKRFDKAIHAYDQVLEIPCLILIWDLFDMLLPFPSK